MEEARDFVRGCFTASTTARSKLIRDLQPAILSKGLSDSAVRAIVCAAGDTLFRYSDKKSKTGIHHLLECLCERYGSVASGPLCEVVQKASCYFKGVQSHPHAKSASVVLGWSCLPLQHGAALTPPLLTAQSHLLAAATFSKRPYDRAVGILHRLWKNKPSLLSEYFTCLKKAGPSLPGLCLLAALCGWSWNDNLSLEEVLEYFVSTVLQSRSKPCQVLLEACSAVLGGTTHQLFKSLLLPPTLKCLLRNPDELLEAVSWMFSVVPLDCSRYAVELLKKITVHFSSSVPSTRKHAVALVCAVARQTSDGEVAAQMLKVLSSVLTGGEGKLALPEHRVAVLLALQGLKDCPITATHLEALTCSAVEELTRHAKREAHMPTVTLTIGVLQQWITKLPSSPPPSLLPFIKTALSEKIGSSQRIGYLLCLRELCERPVKASLVSLQTELLQVSVLEEAVIASYVVLSANEMDATKVWVQVNSCSLVSPKLLKEASESTLLILVLLMEKVLLSHSTHSLQEQVERSWLRSLVLLAVTKSLALHTSASKCLARLVAERPNLAGPMVASLCELALKEDLSDILIPRALIAMATPGHAHKEQLAKEALLVSHKPAVLYQGLWVRYVSALGLDPKAFASQHMEDLLGVILNSIGQFPDSSRACLSTVLSLEPKLCAGVVCERVREVFGSARVLCVSEADVEVMCTPPGHLWHKDMLKELEEAFTGLGQTNLKRESKAYSFAEQKWDARVRQEQYQKYRELFSELPMRQLLDKAQLSDKKRQDIEAQLEKEQSTRERLLKVDKELSELVRVVDVACGKMVEQAPAFVPVLLRGMSAPLSAPHCTRMWRKFSSVLLQDWETGQLFGEVSVQCLSGEEAAIGQLPNSLPKLLKLLCSYSPPSTLCQEAIASLTLPLVRALVFGQASPRDLIDHALNLFTHSCRAYSECDVAMGLFPIADAFEVLNDAIATDKNALALPKVKRRCVECYGLLCGGWKKDWRPEPVQQLVCALHSPSSLLRHTALEALDTLGKPALLQPSLQLQVAILVAKHDVEMDNRTLADKLWRAAGYSLSPEMVDHLITGVCSQGAGLQCSTAEALGRWLEAYPTSSPSVARKLTGLYQEKNKPPPAQRDSFGRVVYVEFRDTWEARVGVVRAFATLPAHLSPEEAMKLMGFLVPEALGDRREEVRGAVMDAARSIITAHGEKLSAELMQHLDKCVRELPNTSEADPVRQSLVVLMGDLAKHMDKDNTKVKEVIEKLLLALDTPSQQVQESIANCLASLSSTIKPDAEKIVSKLMDKLLESPKYSQRRGSAHGLAGVVKGLGIPTLKQLGVIQELQKAIRDKKHYQHRESALFAFETLCSMLGRLFEPYVVHLLPDLLLCFGDGNQYVREATDQTSRVIMANLSSHGVKLILPSLLSALEEDSWRTKAGSAELLGAMAHCAPRQLSSCLPSIVPRLMEVLTDSHSKVQNAGSMALKQIGSVIKNPEVQQLVPLLLDALGDPGNKARGCLQVLLSTEFVHKIDAPCLALIMPTVKCALEQRSVETKRNAAQIIRNMYSLTDQKDLSPYLSDVLPGLKQSLVDPVPEVRAVCAKALGTMVKGMGEESLQELLPWLLSMLKSEGSSVDRSGAAQGLSEVLLAQGVHHLEQLMPHFIASAQDSTSPAHVRDGYLMLFVYLPAAFKEEFVPFINDAIPSILKGLADESEYIRDSALRGGQTIVNHYSDMAVEVFLPELEKGLFDDNWRIRFSSMQLLGDLLYKISGLSGKMSTESEEDDNFGTEEARHTIIEALGLERRNWVLSGLYMGRSDVALLVRQAALHVWKVVVTNTARTLREIMPTLINLLLGSLANRNFDKRSAAARTLGDLVRKLGERVLPEVIPMLEEGLRSPELQKRQGVCIGLSEIIQHTSKEQVMLYLDSLLPTVRSALCDKEADVRVAAAQTFDSLHSTLGHRTLDEVLTPLMNSLSSGEEGESEVALDGVRQVMAVKSNVVLPFVIPRLIKPPVDTKALILLCSAAGEALHRHLSSIVPALIRSLKDQEELESAYSVVLCVQEEPGPSILLQELFQAAASGQVDDGAARLTAMSFLLVMCEKSPANLTEHVPQLLAFTIRALNDPLDAVCEKAWLTLDAVVKGVGPVLSILKEGLITGTPDEKEESSRVLVRVIHLTPTAVLTGRVVMLIAGPLIRVLGDRYGWQVKVATLEALVELVRKVGMAAKPFIPQLQASYLKALNDPSQPVRVQAMAGLRELVPLSPRVDPVFNELINGIKKNEEMAVRQTMLQALCGILESSGARASEKHRSELLDILVALQGTAQEVNRIESAKCLGSLAAHLTPPEQFAGLVNGLLDRREADWAVLQSRAAGLVAVVRACPTRIADAVGLEERAIDGAAAYASSDRVPVSVQGIEAVAALLQHVSGTKPSLIQVLSQCLESESSDVRLAVCQVCTDMHDASDPLLRAILPKLLHATADSNSAVKLAAAEAIGGMLQEEKVLQRCLKVVDNTTGTANQLQEILRKAKATSKYRQLNN